MDRSKILTNENLYIILLFFTQRIKKMIKQIEKKNASFDINIIKSAKRKQK